jgi:hypothetical protein
MQTPEFDILGEVMSFYNETWAKTLPTNETLNPKFNFVLQNTDSINENFDATEDGRRLARVKIIPFAKFQENEKITLPLTEGLSAIPVELRPSGRKATITMSVKNPEAKSYPFDFDGDEIVDNLPPGYGPAKTGTILICEGSSACPRKYPELYPEFYFDGDEIVDNLPQKYGFEDMCGSSNAKDARVMYTEWDKMSLSNFKGTRIKYDDFEEISTKEIKKCVDDSVWRESLASNINDFSSNKIPENTMQVMFPLDPSACNPELDEFYGMDPISNQKNQPIPNIPRNKGTFEFGKNIGPVIGLTRQPPSGRKKKGYLRPGLSFGIHDNTPYS